MQVSPRARATPHTRADGAAAVVARQAAVARRPVAEDVGVEARPEGREIEREVARKEVEDLRQGHGHDRADHQVIRREAELHAEDVELVDTDLAIRVLARPEQEEGHRRGHRRDERHVGHGLVRDQEPQRLVYASSMNSICAVVKYSI